jgi:hypothetical protein
MSTTSSTFPVTTFGSVAFKTYNTADIDSIWELFKTRLVKSIETNVPSKILTYKHRLPWITNSLRKFINKKHKLYKKRNVVGF